MQSIPSGPGSGPGSGACAAAAVSDEALVAAARTARANSYSPYSGLRVGAALLDRDGRVFVGCNVENASYGLTICAERCALLKAVSEGARHFRAIAVVSSRAEPMMPCGACRQMLLEFGADIRVICAGDEGGRVDLSSSDLLPHPFEIEDLLREEDLPEE